MFTIYTSSGELVYSPTDISGSIVFSPKLAMEIGKAGSLEFVLSPSNPFYNRVKKYKSYLIVVNDNDEVFRCRVLNDNKRGFDNLKTIYCEGEIAYLLDSVQSISSYRGSVHDLFRKCIENHNQMVEKEKQFQIGRITVEDREVIISGTDDTQEEFDYKQIALNSISSEWPSTYDYIDSNIIAYCGGYLNTRKENDSVYIDLLDESSFPEAEQEISFGKNLLDISIDDSDEDFFTVLIPIGDENLTIKSVNDGSIELENSNLVSEYGRIVKSKIFQNVTNPETLKENGLRFIENEMYKGLTISIKAVDMSFVDKNVFAIKIGDWVHIQSAPHKISGNFLCTRIEYDLEKPENTVYIFGKPIQTLTQRYREDVMSTTSAISEAASSAAGGGGKKSEEELDEFEKSWIDWDPSIAKVSLGALYKEILKDKDYLLNEVGIDLNAYTDSVNIKSLQKHVDDQDQIISEQSGQITVQYDMIEAAVARVSDLEKDYASLKIKADEIEAKVVDEVNKLNSTITQTAAGIRTNIADEVKGLNSRLSQQADSFGIEIRNTKDELLSGISLNANEIRLKADKTYVDNLVASEINAVKSNVDWMRGQHLTVGTITATGNVTVYGSMSVDGRLAAGSMYCNGTVATESWVNSRGFLTSLPSHSHPLISHYHEVYLGSQTINGIKVPSLTGYIRTTAPK